MIPGREPEPEGDDPSRPVTRIGVHEPSAEKLKQGAASADTNLDPITAQAARY